MVEANKNFDLQTKDRLGYSLIILSGGFTVKNLFHIRARLQDLLEDSAQNIVFDLEECNEIDSSGLGILSNLYKKLGNMGGELGVLHISPKIQKILKETGLENLLTHFSSLLEADSHFDV